ncbi:ABC transporter permease [Actinopolymorpha singaporensis]|uniref:Peptide/nickel transport system permease protein n=1 Tax=Actinopolymorpha singaporensis TaxID=117157 RepID=A0A1H1R5E9_9ACTN|nr:ABC transporter permease [Actinopolymorpha singaporensis]SDS30835.1 peptide/nickel transport system permease protein [Actinopolymorpha singaporensis]
MTTLPENPQPRRTESATATADAPESRQAESRPNPPRGRAHQRGSASQSRLVWRAFRKHRLAMIGAAVTLLLYLVAAFAEFLAPFSVARFDQAHPYAPPQRLHVVDTSQGGWEFGLYVNGYVAGRDPDTLERVYRVDTSKKVRVRLFDRGEEYRLWGLVPSRIHLVGPVDDREPMYLLGSDRSGRDLLSRLVYGTRVSMTIGLIGVTMAFVLGVVLGGISGYFGGRTDTLIQRAVEFFMSVPTLPLWLGLAAAVPSGWGPLRRYFAITVILATFAWTDLARVTRGRFVSLRVEDFISSARLDGNRPARMIFRHMLPLFTSHLIASLTLSIPGMILAETALSFLGLGLQAPVVSWGVLLQAAQDVQVVATAPWLMLPGVAVVLAVLSLNFVGDGLRDAADPYRQ